MNLLKVTWLEHVTHTEDGINLLKVLVYQLEEERSICRTRRVKNMY